MKVMKKGIRKRLLGDVRAGRTELEDIYTAEKIEKHKEDWRCFSRSVGVDVIEVCSPPRLCAQASKAGLTAGGSFALETGCNLLTQAGRR